MTKPGNASIRSVSTARSNVAPTQTTPTAPCDVRTATTGRGRSVRRRSTSANSTKSTKRLLKVASWRF